MYQNEHARRGGQTPLRFLKAFLPSAIIVALCLSLFFIQLRIATLAIPPQQIRKFSRLPRGEILKTVVLGYDQVVADILFLQVVQVVGEKKVLPEDYDWVYHATDLLTTLDPRFGTAYEFSGIILSELGRLPEKGNLLLQKGQDANPLIWKLPFHMGYNYFFHLKDYRLAAKKMAIASRLPGHPGYLPGLAARLFVQSNEKETAIVFLQGMIAETKYEKTRNALLRRIKDIYSGKTEGISDAPSQ